MSTEKRPALERELKAVQARVGRLTDAVAAGKGTDSLLSALAVEDAKKKDITRKLAELDGAGKVATLDGARLKKVLAKQVSDVQALLGKSTPMARQAHRSRHHRRPRPLTPSRRPFGTQ